MRSGGFTISKIHQLSGRTFSKLLKENGIQEFNPGQGRILFTLWNGGDMTMSVLSERTGLEKSTLTRMVERMEALGHVSRKTGSDRRVVMVGLSNTAKALQADYRSVSQQMIDLYYRGFTEEEKDCFESFLSRILENLMVKSEGSVEDK